MTLLFLLAVVLFVCLVGGAVLAHSGRDRWGIRQGAAAELGAGPYRGGSSRPWIPRGTPTSAAVAGVFSFLWGPLTFLVFAPAGLLLCLAPAGNNALGPLVVLTDLIVSLNGLILPFGLVLASSALLANKEGAGKNARQIASWSILHHLGVIVSFGLRWLAAGVGADEGAALFGIALLPCLLGLAHAALLHHAGHRVESIQKAMGAQELEESLGVGEALGASA